MNQPSGATQSKALTTERVVRDAYESTGRRRMLGMLWKAGKWYYKLSFVTGVGLGIAALAMSHNPTNSSNWLMLMMPGMGLAAFGYVNAERCAFREHFREYGSFLHKGSSGDPSRLRYLNFLSQLHANSTITGQALTQLLPALEARTLYRESFFREHLVLTVLTALLAMLTSAAVAHPVLWSTPLGGQVWITTASFWVAALLFSRNWRAVRPSREARERELIAFMHQAAMDLE